MRKTLLKLFLLVSAFMCGLGAWADNYTVTFGCVPEAGGSITAKNTVDNVESTFESGASIAANTKIALTAVPKSGYKFVGWYRDTECNTLLTNGNIYQVDALNASITAYAKFTNENNYNIKSSLTDCTIAYTEGVDKLVAVYNTTVTFTLSCNSIREISESNVKVSYVNSNNETKYVTVTKKDDGSYSFTMPASDVTITAIATSTIGGTNDIVITESNKTNPITGSLTGNVYIVLNEEEGKSIDVYFDNVTFANSNWESSLIITSRQQNCHVNLYFKGECAIVSNSNAGIIINPSSYTVDQYPLAIYLKTVGQSNIYIGSNKEDKEAIVDELYAKSGALGKSTITFNDAKFYQFKYSESYNVTTSDGITWVTPEGSTTVTSLVDYCKSKNYVNFLLNQASETRTASGGWVTACYPYDTEVTGGTVYTVFARIMWAKGDPEMTATRGEEGKLKHLILRLREEANITKMDAGKAYFIKKNDGGSEITFTMTGNTYTDPIKYNGFIGSYTKMPMAVGSYFLNGSQILEVQYENTNNVTGYRAYFPYVSDTDNFLTNVAEYVKSTGDTYTIYGRSSGTGGTDWNTNWNSYPKTVSVKFDGFAVVDEEETTALNDIIDNKIAVSSQYYDLQGRKVNAPKKGGLYIVNGKKVLY